MRLLHEDLDVYALYLEFVRHGESILSTASTSIVALDHFDRAMESIGVNLLRAVAQPLGSPARGSYLDVSIASDHECAACLDVCLAKYVVATNEHDLGTNQLWRIRGMLLGLKRANAAAVQEERASYGTPMFPFARLDMYKLALDSVRWTHELLQECDLKTRAKRKLDSSTTGTVLNIAEGHGRVTVADQRRFMKTAQEHAFQTVLSLDLMVARGEAGESRIREGKALQTRVLSMLHAWCNKNDAGGKPSN